MHEPLVSIVINNYNYGRFLPEAIESALGQTYSRIEVIVVDDGSTDQSREIIELYASRGKVKPVFKENGGQATAFNAGVEAATGDIICFLDSDDWFAPEKVAQVVQDLSLCPQAEWHVHPLIWKRDPSQVAPMAVVPQYKESKCLDTRRDFSQGRAKIHFSATSGLSFKKSLLQRLLPVPPELRITADNYLKFAAAISSPFFLQKTPLAFQRIHGENRYTARRNAAIAKGIAVHIAIARHLAERFPQARPFVYKLLCRQAALALASGQLSLYRQALDLCVSLTYAHPVQAAGRTALVAIKILLERVRSAFPG